MYGAAAAGGKDHRVGLNGKKRAVFVADARGAADAAVTHDQIRDGHARHEFHMELPGVLLHPAHFFHAGQRLMVYKAGIAAAERA